MPKNKEETTQKLGFDGFPYLLQKSRKQLKKSTFEGLSQKATPNPPPLNLKFKFCASRIFAPT